MVGVGSLCCQTPSPCPLWASVSLPPHMLAVAPPAGGPDPLGISSGNPSRAFHRQTRASSRQGCPTVQAVTPKVLFL